MKKILNILCFILGLTTGFLAKAQPIITDISMVPMLTIQSQIGTTNQIQYSTNISQTNWVMLTNLVVETNPYLFFDVTATSIPRRFYKVLQLPINPPTNPIPVGDMVTVLGGPFIMGDTLDNNLDATNHLVNVSTFQMNKSEITYDLWKWVYKYAIVNGYTFDNTGAGKDTNHPIENINWYDAVKWCNARSEMEGLTPCYYVETNLTWIYKTGRIDLKNNMVKWNANGYRLPTEAEWEKAARGGAVGHRFPWVDTDNIMESRANYVGQNAAIRPSYDKGPVGYNPLFDNAPFPYTNPAGAFAANGYGLYDMAGNVAEWCWDWYNNRYYNISIGATDPKGPDFSPSKSRVSRDGSWASGPSSLRCMKRTYRLPNAGGNGIGFRCVKR